MTYALSADQYTDILENIGLDDASEPVFTLTQLNRWFNLAEGDYNLTVVYALQKLLAKAHKYPVYTLGADGLNKQKIFDNLKDLLALWEKRAGVAGGTLSVGMMNLHLDMTDDDVEAEESS